MHIENQINVIKSDQVDSIRSSIEGLRDRLLINDLKKDLQEFIDTNVELDKSNNYLKIPIINVGNRQLGRPLSSNIIQSSFEDISENLIQVQENREKIISDIEFKYKIYDSKEIFIKSLDTILIF